jgi:hypothetical protein
MTGIAGLGVLAAIWLRALWPLGVSLAAELVVVLLNLAFYGYLTRLRGLRFGLATIPLHLGFYVSNVLAVPSGWFAHALLGHPTPRAEAQALEQIGVKTWPPTPARPRTSIWTDERPKPTLPRSGDS